MFKQNPKLKNIIKRKLEKALLESAEVLGDKAEDNAPEDSGELKDSKVVDESRIKDLTVRVKFDAEHADEVEFGTIHQAANPFFRSAIKSSKKKMLKKFEGIL